MMPSEVRIVSTNDTEEAMALLEKLLESGTVEGLLIVTLLDDKQPDPRVRVTSIGLTAPLALDVIRTAGLGLGLAMGSLEGKPQ